MNVVQRFYKIIVAFAFSLQMLMLQAQENHPQLPSITVAKPLSGISEKPWYLAQKKFFNKTQLTKPYNQALPPTPGMLRLPVSSISHDFYTRQFGFFCRQELRLEKASGLPLRFRLGSLNDCNSLEGK